MASPTPSSSNLSTSPSTGHEEDKSGQIMSQGASTSTVSQEPSQSQVDPYDPIKAEKVKRQRQFWLEISLLLLLASCLIIALVLALLGIRCDYKWNAILHGSSKFPEVHTQGHTLSPFSGRNISVLSVLQGNQDVKTLLWRRFALDVSWVVVTAVALLFLGYRVTVVCFDKGFDKKEDVKGWMITLYLGLGFVLICGIGGATTSTNWNYDNQAQVLHKLVVEPGFTNRSQDYTSRPLDSLDGALLLMDIIGICIESSLHHGLEPSQNYPLLPLRSQIFGVLATLMCWILGALTAFLGREVIVGEILRRKEELEDGRVVRELGLGNESESHTQEDGQNSGISSSTTVGVGDTLE